MIEKFVAAEYAWIDDYGGSQLRFLDFSHLRTIIHRYDSLFTAKLPKNARINTLLLDLEPYRNRIGHVNTLTQTDKDDFVSRANRVIGLIKAYAPLK